MNGFDSEIKNRLLLVVPHVTVSHPEGFSAGEVASLTTQIMTDPNILAVVPMVQSFVMLSYDTEKIGVMLQGIDPQWSTVEPLRENMLSGFLEKLAPGDFGIVLGSQVARRLGVFVGDRIQLTMPKVTVTPAGIFPRIKTVTVTGIFQVGAQVDSSVIFVHEQDARKLLQQTDRFQGMRLQLAEPYGADEWIRQTGLQLLPDAKWRSWADSMGTLFQAMRMEKVVVSLLLSVVIAVAAFNIVASLVLMVSDKRKDIAVLQTLGLSRSNIVSLFLMQGSMIGLFGISIGVALGVAGCYWTADMVVWLESALGAKFLETSVYPIDYVPVDMRWSDVTLIAVSALVLNVLATIYPALRASRTVPADELRYE